MRNVLRGVLRNAEHRFADGIGLCADVESIADRACAFLPSSRSLPAVQAAGKSKRSIRLAFLGRWHANKGADLLVDALKILDDEDWSQVAELRFFGGGPLEPYVAASIKSLADQGRPLTQGSYLDRDEAASLIAWADFLIIPSRIESIPVIFSDAVQLGTPIVCTPVGDLPDLMQRHQVGILAEDATAESLAVAIQKALRTSTDVFACGLATASEEFDVASAARQFLDTVLA